MKKILIVNMKEKNKWNEIVKSFSNYDVFYLCEYVEAFKMHGDGEPILFYYDDEKTKAMNVVMKRDISKEEVFSDKIEKNKYFDLSSPYGYGGFIIEGKDYKKVNRAYKKYCKKNNIVSEFVRFHLLEGYEKKYNGKAKNIKHNIIRKLDMDPEEMLMDFEHKVRKNIKKANRNGLQIQIDTEGKTLDNFLNIYYSTMDRNNAEDGYYFKKEFFEKLNEMKENVVYFNVLYEGKVISTELVIYSPNNCYSYLGGTLSEYFNLRPNDFLKYEIIKWAYNKGIKNFILGGGYGGEDDGIYRYKKSFAPNNGIYDFYVGKNIFNKKIYNKLVNIRKKEEKIDLKNSSYFPLYRAQRERKMKKVLFVATINGHIIGCHLPYLKWFKEQGYEVHIASRGTEKIDYCDKHFDLPFERFPLKINNIKAYKELKEIINNNHYDIIHCHTPVGGVLARLAARKERKKGTKVLYTAHGFHFYKGAPLLNWMIYYPIEKIMSHYTDCLITIVNEDYEFAKKHLKVKDIRHINGIGMNTERLSKEITEEQKTKLRKELNINKEDIVFSYVAELNKNKNQILLIETIEKLKEKFSDVKLLLVGEGMLLQKYKETIKSKKLEENISVLGRRNDINEILSVTNIYLASSIREGLGLNIIEAMYKKVPVIATNNRGHRELIQNKKTGILLKKNTFKEMFKEIINFINYSEDKKKKIIDTAKQNVEKYTLENVFKEMKKIYMEFM